MDRWYIITNSLYTIHADLGHLYHWIRTGNWYWWIFPTWVFKGFSALNFYDAEIQTASLVALLAHSRKADRAVINSVRNFLRSIGGAVGLTGKNLFRFLEN